MCESRPDRQLALVLLCAFFSVDPTAAAANRPSPPAVLRCELLRDPADALITSRHPRFSWVYRGSDRGATQRAYQVLVASSAANVRTGVGDIWDSGRVDDDQSINVRYRGAPLEPFTSYWWSVRVWGEGVEGPSRFAEPQQFLTGDCDNERDRWPGESHWDNRPDGVWRLENRQRPHYHAIRPVAVVPLEDSGHYFVDFGKAAFATLRLELEAPGDGHTVTVHLGERSTGDQRVDKQPGISNIAYVREHLELKRGRHSYLLQLPRHTAKMPHSQKLAEHMPEVVPFRFAEIVDCPGKLTPDNLAQWALIYYHGNLAEFHCSNDNLNQVWDLCRHTLRMTPFLGLYADGNRERMPYEADAYIQQLGHYGIDAEYSVGRYTTEFLLYHASWPTEWQMHTLFMAWEDYMHTGDARLLETHYDLLKSKTLIDLSRDDGPISTRTGLVTEEFLRSLNYEGDQFADVVDWPPGTPEGEAPEHHYQGPLPAGERDNHVFVDYNTVVNAMHNKALRVMSAIAEAVGKPEESAFFARRADLHAKTFVAEFYDPKRGRFRDGIGTDHSSLHSNMFALAFGLVPANQQARVIEYIKSRGMACGVYGAHYLLEGLFDTAEGEYAMWLMTSEDRRSWMNMIRAGSTMTTEAWDEYYKPNLTWNHAWATSPANHIVRNLMGVEPLTPGWGRFQIAPQIDLLSQASLKLPTLRGEVRVSWSGSDGGDTRLDVAVPGNTVAVLQLPAQARHCFESGKPLCAASGVQVVQGEGATTVEVGAGEYRFLLRKSGN